MVELYLDTQFFFVKIYKHSLCIDYINTHDMLADPITKCLPPKFSKSQYERQVLLDKLI